MAAFRSGLRMGTKDFLEVGYRGGLGRLGPLPIFSSGKWVAPVLDEEEWVFRLLR